MSETLNQDSPPINVNLNQLTAAILCRLSGQPERFQVLSRQHQISNYVLSGSSEHLQRTKIIRWDQTGCGWVAGATHLVRLAAPGGGKLSKLRPGERVTILPQFFGPERFVIGEVYDLDELTAEAKRRSQTVEAA